VLCSGNPVISLCALRKSLLRRPVELGPVDAHAACGRAAGAPGRPTRTSYGRRFTNSPIDTALKLTRLAFTNFVTHTRARAARAALRHPPDSARAPARAARATGSPSTSGALPNPQHCDASFPAFQNLAGISIGGISNFTSPTLGPVSYSETVLSSGTVRGRIGYAPGNWLFYATGGFASSYDQLTLTQLASGTTDMPFLWRLGWAAGAGVEVPVAPRWTARLEYLFTDYATSSVLFANAGQWFNSDFSLQELRAGLNYQFGNDDRDAPGIRDLDRFLQKQISNARTQVLFLCVR